MSYPELEGLHPLSYRLILWGGGVGHLELEQVIASWSIAVLVKHNRGASTACTEQERENAAKGQQNRKVSDAGVTGTASLLIREKHELLTSCLLLCSGLQGLHKGPQSVWFCSSQLKPPTTMTCTLNISDNQGQGGKLPTDQKSTSWLATYAWAQLHNGHWRNTFSHSKHEQDMWTLSCALISEIDRYFKGTHASSG